MIIVNDDKDGLRLPIMIHMDDILICKKSFYKSSMVFFTNKEYNVLKYNWNRIKADNTGLQINIGNSYEYCWLYYEDICKYFYTKKELRKIKLQLLCSSLIETEVSNEV